MNQLAQILVGATVGGGWQLLGAQALHEAREARSVARATLRRILAVNGDTAWGRRRGLHRANALAAFGALPPTTYEDYAAAIERMAAGERGVLTGAPVTHFVETSGTTGAPKLMPVTRRQSIAVMRSSLASLGVTRTAGLLGPMRGRLLQIMTEDAAGAGAGGSVVRSGVARGRPATGGLPGMERLLGLIWTSPLPVLRVRDQAASRYLHLLFALGEERLWTIHAFYPSTLFLVLRDLQARAGELLRDLADGTISRRLDLPAGVRQELAGRLHPNPARARALERLLERGALTVPAVWPEVGAVLTTAGPGFGPDVDRLAPFLGGVPVHSPLYRSTEAVIGIGLGPEQTGHVVTPRAAYHEFLPVTEAHRPDARPLAIDEVEPGETYEILVTTYAGLTRYRLGDEIRVVARYGEAPVVEFSGRSGRMIDLGAERVSELQISRAFEAARREAGESVVDYLVTPDPEARPARLLLLVERPPAPARAGGWDRGGDRDAGRLLQTLERRLRQTAPDYDAARRAGRLAPIGAAVLKPGAFERYRQERIAAGAPASRVKVPHTLPDAGLARRYFGHEGLAQAGSWPEGAQGGGYHGDQRSLSAVPPPATPGDPTDHLTEQ